MSARFPCVALAWVIALAGCAPTQTASDAAPAWEPRYAMTEVTLPDGSKIQAEVCRTPQETEMGMMYRPQLPPDHGMLFLFDRLEQRPFYMFRTLHPLDMIWMDDSKRIVEIHENAPPCPARDARDCPIFGGSAASVYTLELPAGQVLRRGLKVGDQLEF